MNPTVLNREFQHPADGWYQIEALGNHPNQAAGLVQIVDPAAATAIVNRFNADAAAGQLRHGHEMLIDHEHFSDQPDQETRAYGWLQELQNRSDQAAAPGIYGRIRWTTTGQAAVDGGDYRFFSTEYEPADFEEARNAERGAAGGKAKLMRPLRLAGLSLTNLNNNRGQKPITNRGDGHDSATFVGAGAPAAGKTGKRNNQTEGHDMQKIATALGLAAEAGEDSILVTLATVQNRVKELEPLHAENTKLKNRVSTLETEQIAGLFAERKVSDEKVINRLTPVLAGLPDRAERLAFLDELGIKPASEVESARVLNRGGASAAVAAAGTAGTDDRATAQKIRNRANELKGAGPKRAFDDCWNQAAQEVGSRG